MSTTVLSNESEVSRDRGRGLFLRRIDGQDDPVLTNIPGRRPRVPRDRSGTWLRVAMAALAVLALTAAIVSYQAQYQLIYAYKGVRIIAALQAAIPDAAALVFAALGIALALTGKRAIRARILNVAAVGTSIVMNLLAASSGWKAMAVWVLAPVAYAVTSDTLIGVLRSWTLARQRELNEDLADDDDSTPLAAVGKVILYGARFVLAPPSTAKGLRQAVLQAAPLPEAEQPKAIEGPKPPHKPRSHRNTRGLGKQDRLIKLAVDEHGLASLPLDEVSKLATELASKADIHPATARRVLIAYARELHQDGGNA
jgi:hypothetical protein